MNAAEIALLLGGKRAGRQYLCCCPAHDDHSPSLIVFDGHTNVQVRCLSGCPSVEVLRAINDRAGDNNYTPQFIAVDKADDAREAEANAKLALRIWDETLDPRRSIVESYLIKRGLALPDNDPGRVIRFHPRCPRGNKQQPAMVVLMRDIKSNERRAIQRIYLTEKADKDGAMMLGPVSGCAMKLTSQTETFSDPLSTCERLYVCEGCETGLALMGRRCTPVWALGSAGAMARMPFLSSVCHLIIAADHDEPGLRAAEACRTHWSKGYADIWVPHVEGTDFADVAMEEAKHG